METSFTFPGFEDVEAGIVKWPMSVIRIAGGDPDRLGGLAGKILAAWGGSAQSACLAVRSSARRSPP